MDGGKGDKGGVMPSIVAQTSCILIRRHLDKNLGRLVASVHGLHVEN